MTWLAILASAWAADTWWVADEGSRVALEAALEETWPERDIEVVVGARPESAMGTSWDGRLLLSYGEGGVRHADVDDATVAALLARSWALPAGPSAPERYLPSAPVLVNLDPPEVVPPKEELHDRFRLSSGLGARGSIGQPRPVEGLRVVNELARRGVIVQSDVFFGMSLRWASGALENDKSEGSVVVVPMDRATAGLSLGLQSQGTVAFRVLAGPEVRFVEDWLFFRGEAAEAAPSVALGGRLGAGADWDIGRFVVGPVAYVRGSTAAPVVSAGASLDLRYQWKR